MNQKTNEGSMKRVKIGNIKIGDGDVKICVSISPTNKSELIEELYYATNSGCDIIEFRYDFWCDESYNVIADENSYFKKNLPQSKPLLFTYRTKFEGGSGSDEHDVYEAINTQAILSGNVDIVDIEFTKPPTLIQKLIDKAHEHGVTTLVSKHYFEKNLSETEILEELLKMQETGADIIKLAVAAYDEQDAKNVINAAKEMYEKYAKVPIITIGMGEHGKITRHIKPFYGSSMTYAKGMKATASGQMSVAELRGLGL